MAPQVWPGRLNRTPPPVVWISLAVALVTPLEQFSRASASGQPNLEAYYEIVWTTPSQDHYGTMPLGNGEVALNAWIDREGCLRLFLARGDAWDTYGRLLKVGGLRLWVEKPDPVNTKYFRQKLTVRDGTMWASFGQEEPGQVHLRLWVDAHRPVVYIEWTTDQPTVAYAQLGLWRTTRETLPPTEASDVLMGHPDKLMMTIEPDTLVPAQEIPALGCIVGWYRHNKESVGPELCAKLQGVADFPREDPLRHRTFGAIVLAPTGLIRDSATLACGPARSHRFEVAVHTAHPSSPESWLESTVDILKHASQIPLEKRRGFHEEWWKNFWSRSFIHIWEAKLPDLPQSGAPIPANSHPVRIAMDQAGGSQFAGQLGRVTIWEKALTEKEVVDLARTGPEELLPAQSGFCYQGVPSAPLILSELAQEGFASGLTVEAWCRFDQEPKGAGGRIVDKITPGGADGFLLDFHPGSTLRAIVGDLTVRAGQQLALGKWHHVALVVRPTGEVCLFLDGKQTAKAWQEVDPVGLSDAMVVARAYALQRYLFACAGRGRYPIKFNGSLFTVPEEGRPGHADYRQWGPGYWWQNTRLPYYGMCAAGDFDLMLPLFRMYVDDLMPLFQFRTRRYFGHGGAFIPECIYFWGDVFPATYGWTPFELREDKLQESRWHKWEWVSGLELVWLLLDYWEHTEDKAFLKTKVLPTADAILRFFDEHYPDGPDGKMRLYPAQALETWWDCENPMPEVAGLHAVTARLLSLPEELTTAEERSFWQRLRDRLPEIPLRTFEDGQVGLAPARQFRDKRNIENPELYAVFPFRLLTAQKPNVHWAMVALDRRTDRGALGWRQDDIFLAYLGRAEEAKQYVVQRARRKHPPSRFPAFWGPNYDWIPDQDHGAVLMKAVQAMLLQVDGRKIYLLPAWPREWEADFRLHAPYRTVLEGRIRQGRLVQLVTTPPERAADVEILGQADLAK
ncbi:MAG: DUF5703 domain-containing protein [Thermoguttaceae bacterium]|nr:DUF5703 domain-containing protein [Thermoguttaceae bacterium]MDW8077610.1 DUF5703 domain-containing protein [Thermoguttaceae bacterium]